MEISEISIVYFSATYTTREIARLIASKFEYPVKEYDITQLPFPNEVHLGKTDLLIAAMPVYAGRIPPQAVGALNKFKGEGTPAVLACVYGNRDYDDALLELKDKVETNGFRSVAAGAFIARHSIFPKVGTGRPDERDMDFIGNFAGKSMELLKGATDTDHFSKIQVKGNYPYKVPGSISLHPKGKRNCNWCGKCAGLCPVQAIPVEDPKKTDKEICISCGRCIVVCPQHARSFTGVLYKVVEHKFVKAYSARREPEAVFAELS